jgi:hypothetical protein
MRGSRLESKLIARDATGSGISRSVMVLRKAAQRLKSCKASDESSPETRMDKAGGEWANYFKNLIARGPSAPKNADDHVPE